MADQQQRYRVVEKLESGGMAEVFLAESEGLQGFRKQVAIKRVLPHLAEKKQFIGMFLDEARVSAHLSHSNCVQVFDIGVGDNTYFIVMEYVDGSEVKIVDFGLAKANSQLERSEPGIIKGKFSYLSPEAAKGGTVDARTDIFAVGIILWELLSGRRLFMGDTDFATV